MSVPAGICSRSPARWAAPSCSPTSSGVQVSLTFSKAFSASAGGSWRFLRSRGCGSRSAPPCWRMCMPAGTRLSFGQALSAFLAGDAVGSVTPLGLLASEPTKVLLTRHHLATGDSVASLAIENLIYTASVAAMVVVGLVVVLATVPLTAVWQLEIVAALAGDPGGGRRRALAAAWDVGRQPGRASPMARASRRGAVGRRRIFGGPPGASVACVRAGTRLSCCSPCWRCS